MQINIILLSVKLNRLYINYLINYPKNIILSSVKLNRLYLSKIRQLNCHGLIPGNFIIFQLRNRIYFKDVNEPLCVMGSI